MTSRYRMLGNKENNGSTAFSAETIVDKELFEALGKDEIIKIVTEVRAKIRQLREVKNEIYGEGIESEDITGFPDKVYFQDTITNAIVSFESIDVDDVVSRNYDFVLVTGSFSQNGSDKKAPVILDTKEKCEALLEAPHVFQFESVVHYSKAK